MDQSPDHECITINTMIMPCGNSKNIDELASIYPIVGRIKAESSNIKVGIRKPIRKDLIEFTKQEETMTPNIRYIIYCTQEYEIIIGHEEFNEEFIRLIKGYCPCQICTGYFWNQFLICSCCIGCIHSTRPSYKYIIAAIKEYEKYTTNPVKPY